VSRIGQTRPEHWDRRRDMDCDAPEVLTVAGLSPHNCYAVALIDPDRGFERFCSRHLRIVFSLGNSQDEGLACSTARAAKIA
jgi:hypothetical protein